LDEYHVLYQKQNKIVVFFSFKSDGILEYHCTLKVNELSDSLPGQYNKLRTSFLRKLLMLLHIVTTSPHVCLIYVPRKGSFISAKFHI